MERNKKIQGVEMKYSELPERERMAIDMAACGCISGTLKEWPYLMFAFINFGMFPEKYKYVFMDMPAHLIKKQCSNILKDARSGGRGGE